jgi:hypothetical protein
LTSIYNETPSRPFQPIRSCLRSCAVQDGLPPESGHGSSIVAQITLNQAITNRSQAITDSSRSGLASTASLKDRHARSMYESALPEAMPKMPNELGRQKNNERNKGCAPPKGTWWADELADVKDNNRRRYIQAYSVRIGSQRHLSAGNTTAHTTAQ